MPLTIATHSIDNNNTHLDIDGVSGMQYRFLWNAQAGRYEHTVTTQEAATDLLLTQSLPGGYLWPLIAIVGDPSPSSAKPSVAPKQYESLEDDDLRALLDDTGIEHSKGDKRQVLLRLLGAYFKGVGYGNSNKTA